MSLFLRMAWRNILRNKRRSISTGLAVIFGFAGLALLGGYIVWAEAFIGATSIYLNHAGHISIYKKDGLDKFYSEPNRYQLTKTDLDSIADALGDLDGQIEFTTPYISGYGLLSNGKLSRPFLANGVDPDVEKRIHSHPMVLRWAPELVGTSNQGLGSGAGSEDISITKQLGTLIDRYPPFGALSEDLRDIQLAARTYSGDFNAVNGRLSFKHSTGFALAEPTSLLAPLNLLRELYGTDGAAYLAIFLKERYSVSRNLKLVQEKLAAKNLNFDVHPFDDDRISLFYTGTLGFLYIMAGFFVFLIFSAVILSILNSVTITILERRKEIGTLKSIGYTEKRVAQLFTQEAVLLTVLSLFIGLMVAKMTAFAVNSANIRFYPPGIAGDMQFQLEPQLWLCASLALPIVIFVLVTAYWVSYRQVQMSVASLMYTNA